MKQDYGFKVSDENVDARVAELKDLLFTSTWPLLKLDRTKEEPFRNTALQFINNTPDGVKTEVHKIKHGYAYKPDVWVSVQNNNTQAQAQQYFQDTGIVAFGTNVSETAIFTWEADETYVYFYITRTTVSIIGYRLLIRTYIFVDDIGM